MQLKLNEEIQLNFKKENYRRKEINLLVVEEYILIKIMFNFLDLELN